MQDLHIFKYLYCESEPLLVEVDTNLSADQSESCSESELGIYIVAITVSGLMFENLTAI